MFKKILLMTVLLSTLFLAKSYASTTTQIISVGVHIDGVSELILSGGTARWNHIAYREPGVYYCGGGYCYAPPLISGTPLSSNIISVSLNVIQGRGTVSAWISDPNTIVVRFDDGPQGGDFYYIINIAVTYFDCSNEAEVCDGKDNNCNGQVDEGLSTDADGDGHYAFGSCMAPSNDCSDGDAATYPGAPEICDGRDNNCDGQTDEGCCVDNDHDGYYAYNAVSCPQGNDCNDGDPSINHATKWYKDFDNDGFTDWMTVVQCQRPAGYKLSSELIGNQADCDDNNANVNTIVTWYKDADGDGYTDGPTLQQCTQPSGYVQSAVSGDCNDNDGTIHPGAYEVCDGKDNNCEGNIDETCAGQQCNNGTEVGSSANLASGNLYHSQDLVIGSKTNFVISYNSLDSYNGPLGKGWTHNYNISITEGSDKSISLMKGDGKRIYFWSIDGTYYPEMRSGEYSTIVKKADGTYTLAGKEGITYSFNPSGRLTTITDRNGNTTTLLYSGNDLTAITNPAGKTTAIAASEGKITAITAQDGSSYALTYAGNLLSSITDPEGNSWQFTYDSNERMLTKTDPNGYMTTYNYDGSGKLISSIDPEGRTKNIAYDQINNTATVTEKDGGVWAYEYDNKLNVTLKKTDPEGNITSYTYDENRNMTSKTEPDGSVTSYTYDASGNMTSTTDALNQTTNYTYNSYGQVTSMTAPDSTTTSYEYDAKGNLTQIKDAAGQITTYSYDSAGNVVQITNAAGQTTKFTYDQNNNLSSVTDPTGATTSFTYDTAGNMTSQTDASGNTTRFEYNSLGRLIKVIDPSGNSTNSTYDNNGNKTSETDANGNVTYYEYNYKGQLIKVKDALGNVTTYTYGGTGCSSCGGGTDKLTVITDANGNETKYEYDKLGRLIKETDQLGNAISYSYDSKGNLISKTDANGATTSYSYDGLGRLLKKAYPDNTTETFSYDAKGNILTATNANTSYTFTYNTSGKVASVADSSGRTVSYSYDSLGNKTKLIYPEGSTVTYSYDSANRLKSIVNGGGKTYTFQYDTAGRRTKLSLPNGATANYSYDNSGRLTSLIHKTSTGSVIASNAYTHDKVGNRLSNATQDRTLSYQYDPIYRLTEALSSTPGYSSNTTGKGQGITTATQQQKEFYTYDSVGNRLSSDKYSSYTYNQANQLQTNGGIYSYDKNGNLTTKIEGTMVYSYYYDYENRLVKVIKVENGSTTTAEYKYDPFGRRIEKKVTEGGTATVTRFVYDNEDIILEYDGSGSIGNRYVHGPGIDEPLAVISGKNSYYYHADGLGSIVALTDSTGKVQQTYEYDSFGNLKDQKNKIKQPYTFTGREWDREAGVYYYNARYYDSKAGRFLQRDPIGFDGGDVNLYVYVKNNATTAIDPSGLELISLQEGLKIIAAGETYIGTPYSKMDCSHFVNAAYGKAGFSYGYSTTSQFDKNPKFKKVPNCQAGDVALFLGHMGIYNPNPPKAGYNILSATTSKGVRYGEASWFGSYSCYRYDKECK